MARSTDICVFGATGFTGFRVLLELCRSEGARRHQGRVLAAVRSPQRLQAMLRDHQLEHLEVISVDVSDDMSLKRMAARTRLVLNCVGPYRIFGEPVFAACCLEGTDYLDVTGEPDFIERMEHKYHQKAQENGCLMASAAGFDSVIADLGVLHAMNQLQSPAVPSSVESFLTVYPGPKGAKGHFATWHSAVLGMGSAQDLRHLRQEIKRAGVAPGKPSVPGKAPKTQSGALWDPRVSAYSITFPGSDASVVRRTQAARGAAGLPAVHYAAFFTVVSRIAVLGMAFVGLCMQVLAIRSWGRWLMLTFPGFFSLGMFSEAGPTQEQMASTWFRMTFFTRGFSCGVASQADNPSRAWLDGQAAQAGSPAKSILQAHPTAFTAEPDVQVVSHVSGPEPGYKATPIIIVQCSLALLEERDRAPKPGGVFTVGTLLRDTTIIQRLHKAGVLFEVESVSLRQPGGAFKEALHGRVNKPPLEGG
ncbi:hypothetical protein WJX73_005481 [Symbiochloris irregularis]|uniref:Saccharopine dehydrogenase NADP binding domain-containing protein n=1 Tax=Symbiochloris irregularis TaxID=706552 RepID=A0AAW1NVF4_9CHLO